MSSHNVGVLNVESVAAIREAVASGDIMSLVGSKALAEANEWFSAMHQQMAAGPLKATDSAMLAPVQQSVNTTSGSTTIDIGDIRKALQQVYHNITVPYVVVCGTGTGKTTTMPFVIKEFTSKNVLLIQPNEIIIEGLVYYLRDKPIEAYLDYRKKIPNRNVVVTTANIMLSKIANDPTAFDRFSTILIDECHVNNAVYSALKSYLYDNGANFKVLHLTATHGNSSAKFTRQYNVGENVVELDSVAKIDDGLPANSLIAPRNIKGPNLFFVANIEQARKVEEYYKNSGVYSMSFAKGDDRTKYAEILRVLKSASNRAMIIAVDDTVECGVTLPLNGVIDSGMKQILGFDPTINKFYYMQRPISKGEEEQRMGRAGRLRDGNYIKFKFKNVKLDDIEPYMKFYSYLWLIALNIKPIETQYKNIKNFYGYMSVSKARQLLMLKIHPYVANFFFDGDGVYRNVHSALSEFLIDGGKLQHSNIMFAPSFQWGKYCASDQRMARSVQVPIPINNTSVFSSVAAYLVLSAINYKTTVINDIYNNQFASISVDSIEPAYFDEEEQLPLNKVTTKLVRRKTIDTRSDFVDDVSAHQKVDDNYASTSQTIVDAPRSSFDSSKGRRRIKWVKVNDISTLDYGSIIVPHKNYRPNDLDDLSEVAMYAFKLGIKENTFTKSQINEKLVLNFIKYWNNLQEQLAPFLNLVVKARSMNYWLNLKRWVVTFGNHKPSPKTRSLVLSLLKQIDDAKEFYTTRISRSGYNVYLVVYI